jgi:hypothetical protein
VRELPNKKLDIVIEGSLEDLYRQWKNKLTASENLKIVQPKDGVHFYLTGFKEAALRLHFLYEEKKISKGRMVGEALNKYFSELFRVSAEEFEQSAPLLIKPIENELKIYEKLVGSVPELPQAIRYDWKHEIKTLVSLHSVLTQVKNDIENSVPTELALKKMYEWKKNTALPDSIIVFLADRMLFEDPSVYDSARRWFKSRQTREILDELEDYDSDTLNALGQAQKIVKLIKEQRKRATER